MPLKTIDALCKNKFNVPIRTCIGIKITYNGPDTERWGPTQTAGLPNKELIPVKLSNVFIRKLNRYDAYSIHAMLDS